MNNAEAWVSPLEYIKSLSFFPSCHTYMCIHFIFICLHEQLTLQHIFLMKPSSNAISHQRRFYGSLDCREAQTLICFVLFTYPAPLIGPNRSGPRLVQLIRPMLSLSLNKATPKKGIFSIPISEIFFPLMRKKKRVKKICWLCEFFLSLGFYWLCEFFYLWDIIVSLFIRFKHQNVWSLHTQLESMGN